VNYFAARLPKLAYTTSMRAFKIYVGVMLFLITGFLAALTIAVIVVGVKLHAATNKVNDFSKKTDSINSSLQTIRTELQSYNNNVPTSLLPR
jgi:hypothetical protein